MAELSLIPLGSLEGLNTNINKAKGLREDVHGYAIAVIVALTSASVRRGDVRVSGNDGSAGEASAVEEVDGGNAGRNMGARLSPQRALLSVVAGVRSPAGRVGRKLTCISQTAAINSPRRSGMSSSDQTAE